MNSEDIRRAHTVRATIQKVQAHEMMMDCDPLKLEPLNLEDKIVRTISEVPNTAFRPEVDLINRHDRRTFINEATRAASFLQHIFRS